MALGREEVDPTRLPHAHAEFPARWINTLHDGTGLQPRELVRSPLALALAGCVLLEVSVGIVIWLALGQGSGEAASAAARPSGSGASVPIPTTAPAAATTLDLTWVYPTIVPRQAAAAPIAAAPVATQVPDADQVWSSLAPNLDATRTLDTPRTVQTLQDFLVSFPDYAPAKEKLYSALLSYGADLQQAGDSQAATQVLQRAQALQPDRGEAGAALLALTASAPDPTPATAVLADTNDAAIQVAAANQPDQASQAASDSAAPDAGSAVADVQSTSHPQAVSQARAVQAAPVRVAPPTPVPQPVNTQPQRAASSARPAANPAPPVVRSAPAAPPAPPAAPPVPTKAPFVAPAQR